MHNNPSISEIDKFYHLRDALRDSAINIIKQIPLLSANYELPWTSLVERYDNKRILANEYFSKILKFKFNERSTPLGNHQSFIKNFYENVSALKHMNLPDLADYIFINLALRAVDSKN